MTHARAKGFEYTKHTGASFASIFQQGFTAPGKAIATPALPQPHDRYAFSRLHILSTRADTFSLTSTVSFAGMTSFTHHNNRCTASFKWVAISRWACHQFTYAYAICRIYFDGDNLLLVARHRQAMSVGVARNYPALSRAPTSSDAINNAFLIYDTERALSLAAYIDSLSAARRGYACGRFF